MGIEQIQNRYRTDIEQILNGNKSQKRKKAFFRMQTIREHVLQNTMLVSFAVLQC